MSDVVLFLDWDVSYRYWHSHVRNATVGKRSVGWMKNRLRLLRDGAGSMTYLSGKLVVCYRRSASGRIHVRIDGIHPGCSQSLQLVVRTLFDDDDARVYLDIVRWCRGESTNRLFDTKWSGGKIRHAGPWIFWFTSRSIQAKDLLRMSRTDTA